MNVTSLFDAYKEHMRQADVEKIFKLSAMKNEFGTLDYGFFPLGSGLLTDRSRIADASISHCNVMVLGNDFGTIDYVQNRCPDKKERSSNPTIKNLMSLGLDQNTTFFTNFFMGLRIGNKMTGVKKLNNDYKKFCYCFFRMQLDYLNPRIVLCLGNEVLQTLREFSPETFPSDATVTKLYTDDSSQKYIIQAFNQKFIMIPHPSYAHLNWAKNNIRDKIIAALKEN